MTYILHELTTKLFHTIDDEFYDKVDYELTTIQYDAIEDALYADLNRELFIELNTAINSEIDCTRIN